MFTSAIKMVMNHLVMADNLVCKAYKCLYYCVNLYSAFLCCCFVFACFEYCFFALLSTLFFFLFLYSMLCHSFSVSVALIN